MYSKFGRSKWILVGQMLKLVGKWPAAISSTDQASKKTDFTVDGGAR